MRPLLTQEPKYNPAWVFAKNLANGDPKAVAEAASHEASAALRAPSVKHAHPAPLHSAPALARRRITLLDWRQSRLAAVLRSATSALWETRACARH